MKRRAVALVREGQTFATIQRAIWDITNEQFFLVNQRQLNNWVKIVDKLEGCVIARTTQRIKGGGQRVHYMQYDVALYKWFSDRRAQNQPVTARQLNDEAQRIASVDGRMVSRRWLEKFRKRHSIVLRKCQRKTQLSAAERTARLQKYYAYIYLQPFIQSIDTALAALYRSAHHRLYVSHMEHQAKLTAAQQRDLFVELCYSGLTAATANLDVPAIFRDLGYIDPSKAKLRIPYQFAPPEVQP